MRFDQRGTSAGVIPMWKIFNVHYVHVMPAGELAARGRLLGLSEGQYLAESIVVDSEGREVCQSTGAFVKGDTTLGSE